MIFVQISGGLGNQMFQYVFAKYMELTKGQTCALETNFYFNVERAEGYTSRNFELDKLNSGFILINGDYRYSELVYENSFSDDAPIKELSVYVGYWQNKKFFETVKDAVRKELIPKKEIITPEMEKFIDKMQTENSVSLHVRRGDYTNKDNQDLFYALTGEYYQKALSAVQEETKEPLVIYFFSDDIDYVKSEFVFLKGYECVYMPMGEAWQDMFLMSKAKNHVIANSSFSWWGAALSEENSGITVAPSDWYKDQPGPDLYLKNWITI